ncbi:MAG: response regulator [Actinobacteria bacterium]|nr:response regulator [Actinomycetota bacterium]
MNNKTVLVVDDDEDILKSLGIRLKQKGFEVFTAQDAYQAVMMTHKCNPDLLILDIGMPAGSGFTVMQKLSGSSHTQLIPVIMLTALDDEDARDKAKILGALRYFVKPYEFSEVLSAVKEILDPADE